MSTYYYMNGMLHTEQSRLRALAQQSVPSPSCRVVFTDQDEHAVGCIMVHRETNLPLSGRGLNHAQLSDKLPPRLYKSAAAAYLAIETLGWQLADFQVMWVHTAADEGAGS